MLTIKPIQEKTEQEAACARCGIPYDADCMAYGAHEEGEFVGFTLACMSKMDIGPGGLDITCRAISTIVS